MKRLWLWVAALAAPTALVFVVPAGADVAGKPKVRLAQVDAICPVVRTSCAAEADPGSQAA
jgi:hypothetical protein